MEALALQEEFIDKKYNERKARYDLTTQFAELVDGSMRTDFELQFDGHDLIGEDGSSLNKITEKALDEAREIAKVNPNLWFETRRRSFEREEFHELVEIARGGRPNTMVVVSDFPLELMGAKEDVGGYNVSRKQTMLRLLTRKPDGNIHMSSQSLDGSNRQALEAIYAHFGIKPEGGELLSRRINVDIPWAEQETLASELTGTYDRSLVSQYGGEWYAGRRPADYRNTYDFVCRQQDLIEECIRLQNIGWLNRDIMYNVAATMQKRFEDEVQGAAPLLHITTANPTILAELYQEMNAAGAKAQLAGMSFSACGDTLGASNQFEQAGYGNKTDNETEYKFDKKMHCVVCQVKAKEDEPKKMCGPCGICRSCDKKLSIKSPA